MFLNVLLNTQSMIYDGVVGFCGMNMGGGDCGCCLIEP
jgi:hypothetical protein